MINVDQMNMVSGFRSNTLSLVHTASNGLTTFVCALAVLVCSPSAAAQTWLVMPVATSNAGLNTAQTATEYARRSLQASGQTVLDRRSSVAMIEAQHSIPFAPAPEAFFTRIDSTSEGVLLQVARGRNAAAIAAGMPVLDEAEGHLIALNHRASGARALANLCLYLVRADLAERHIDQARERALRCIRMAPDLLRTGDSLLQEARERQHPPEVHDLLRELASTQSSLIVRGSPIDPSGCTVRVQGVPVGRTPRARVIVPEGEYFVQVECIEATAGRLFRVTVPREGTATISISAHLSAALVTHGEHHALVYPDGAGYEHLDEHLAALARLLGADRVLAVVTNEEGVFFRAFEVVANADVARALGSSRVAAPIERSSEDALRAALRGTYVEQPNPEPMPSAGNRSDVGMTVVGGSLLAVGLIGLGVSWYLWNEIDARGQSINRFKRESPPDELATSKRAFDDAFLPVILTGAAGSLMTTFGLPLLLSNEEEVPWWSWLFGATGLGLAAVGVYYIVSDTGTCYGNADAGTECIRRSPNPLLGALILGHASPFVSLTLSHCIRAAIGSSGTSSVSLRIEPSGNGLALVGSF